jgi:hypothetical protein
MAPPARWRWLAAAAALCGQACAAHTAPPRWLPEAKDLPRWSRGAWLQVQPRGGGGRLDGELIAVGPGAVHLLTERGLRVVPMARVASATLVLYEPEGNGGAGLLVLTHGFYLVFTAIPWIAIDAGASRAPRLEHPPWPLESFRPYARFPQGLPPALTPADLGPLLPAPRSR